MSKTRWGKNWGSFERVEWVNDRDLNEVRGGWLWRIVGGAEER